MSIIEKEVMVKSWDSKDKNYMGVIQTSSTKLGKFVGIKVKVKIECIDHVFQVGSAYCIHCGEKALIEKNREERKEE